MGTDVASVTVTAEPSEGASVAITSDMDDTIGADGVVNLVEGEVNTITVTVTAEDGVETQAYTLAISRADADAGTDARLSSVSFMLQPAGLEIGTELDPSFDPDVTSYTYEYRRKRCRVSR